MDYFADNLYPEEYVVGRIFAIIGIICGGLCHFIGYMHILFRLKSNYNHNVYIQKAVRCKECFWIMGFLIFSLQVMFWILIPSAFEYGAVLKFDDDEGKVLILVLGILVLIIVNGTLLYWYVKGLCINAK